MSKKNKTKVKHNILIQDYENAGLKAPDILVNYKTLKYAWVNRIINTNNSVFLELVTARLEIVGGLEYLLLCNYEVNKLPKKLRLNQFLQEILEIYAEIHNIKFEETIAAPEVIKNQIINNNKFILRAGCSLYFKTLADLNMDRISDWLNYDGTILPFQEILNQGVEHKLASILLSNKFCNPKTMEISLTKCHCNSAYFGTNNSSHKPLNVRKSKRPKSATQRYGQ